MKIAVVGAGVSGLGATWLLNEYSDHEVHLFEAGDRAGGHANTVNYRFGSEEVDVDTGFIVFNSSASPNFLRFLSRYPDITILPTEMTFSVSRDRGLFEWAGNGLTGIFCQPSRLLDPSMWRLLYDILRFNACARRLVVNDNIIENISIGEYIAREGYSDTFRDDYLIPVTAAIWSTPANKCLPELPAQTLVKFMSNHHLLQVTGKPSWYTIQGGSRNYVNAILAKLPASQLHLSTPIVSVGNPVGCLTVTTASGESLVFDRVIMACHSDTTLSLLKAAGHGITSEEETILGRFDWNRNEAVLHTDVNVGLCENPWGLSSIETQTLKLMPKSKSAWSCWNYLAFTEPAVGSRVSLTCMRFFPSSLVKLKCQSMLLDNMNHLQHLSADKHGPVLITLNPPVEPARGTVAARFRYDHPILNTKALESQRQMGIIQGRRGILYAGAWLGYGFHEDGFTSGLRAAMYVDGVHPPFEIVSASKPAQAVFVAYVFDFLEWSGIRNVLGKILSFTLLSLGRLMLLGDVNHGKRVT